MYNSEIKENFIKNVYETGNSKYILQIRDLFEKSEDMEKRLDKDLAYFTHQEYLDFYKNLCLHTLSAIKRKIWLVNLYTSWYNENIGRTQKDRFKTEELKALLDIKYTWNYYSEDEVDRFVNDCCPIVINFIVYAIYSGLRGKSLEELTLASIEDIDFYAHKISVFRYNKEGQKEFNRQISVNDLFLKLAQETNNEKVYTDDNGRLLGYLEDSKYIIKRREGSGIESSERILKSKYKMIIDKIDRLREKDIDDFNLQDLTVNSLYFSGMINYIKYTASVLEIDFHKENIFDEECRILLKQAAVKYGTSENKVKQIISEYFEML